MMRAKLHVSDSWSGWTTRADVRLSGASKSPRAYDILDCAWAERLSVSPQSSTTQVLVRDLWANPGQSVHRKPWGQQGCLTSRGEWFSFEFDRTLDALDTLRIQGFPRSLDLSGLSQAQIKDAAGEAFHCASISVFTAAWYYQPWGAWWR